MGSGWHSRTIDHKCARAHVAHAMNVLHLDAAALVDIVGDRHLAEQEGRAAQRALLGRVEHVERQHAVLHCRMARGIDRLATADVGTLELRRCSRCARWRRVRRSRCGSSSSSSGRTRRLRDHGCYAALTWLLCRRLARCRGSDSGHRGLGLDVGKVIVKRVSRYALELRSGRRSSRGAHSARRCRC